MINHSAALIPSNHVGFWHKHIFFSSKLTACYHRFLPLVAGFSNDPLQHLWDLWRTCIITAPGQDGEWQFGPRRTIGCQRSYPGLDRRRRCFCGFWFVVQDMFSGQNVSGRWEDVDLNIDVVRSFAARWQKILPAGVLLNRPQHKCQNNQRRAEIRPASSETDKSSSTWSVNHSYSAHCNSANFWGNISPEG